MPVSGGTAGGTQQRTVLAIDRIGIRPLAYAAAENGLVFASKADVVTAHPSVPGALDPQELFNYLYFHVVPSPGCIYTGVEKLLPGQVVIFDHGKIERRFYWQLQYEESAASEKALAQEMKAVLEQAVRRALNDAPMGTFLSGGLDSSTVTGVLAQVSDKPVDAYAIGFNAEGYDEMDYARASANHFGIRLHEYYVTPEDVVQAIPLIARAYDEPFGNASAIPAYYCALAAKQDGRKLLLAGDGGDEIFAGNARYAKQKLFELYRLLPPVLRRFVMEPFVFTLPGTEKLPPLRKLKSYIEQARIPLPDRLETYNFLHRTPLSELLAPEFLESIDPSAPLDNIRETYDRALSSSSLKRMLFLDLKITLADNDLRKVNHTCALAGLEVCYPMLDEGLVEFAAQVPSRMLLRRFELRSFFRRALADFLAPETLDKRKHGFGLPFGVWMKEHRPLRDLAYDSINDLKRREILSETYLTALVRKHQGEHAPYYGVMIWVLMMLEQWLQAHGY